MARLSLSLLGPFQVTLDGEPVTGFESNKVRALLAYLAVEADRPHRRQSLVGLLWPDRPEAAARGNLRHALANLRRAIDDHHATPPFLSITRDTLQFNHASDSWLDVAAFTLDLTGLQDLSGLDAIDRLEQVVALYRGSFLEGFSLKDSPAFDDWALLTRERLQRQALTVLHQLAAYYEGRGEYERACDYAWRQVELEPWQEEAHQQLMRLLALSGQRSAALAQYESCRRCLAEELGFEPGPEITALYEQIRAGELGKVPHPPAPPAPPPFLGPAPPHPSPSTPFVARERELARLDDFLDQALAGQGRVVFVTGGPGRGKTALIQAFARHAQEAHVDLLVAMGNANAHTGLGDPYLPFREILSMLTGDVEARWEARAISREQAIRSWNAIPRSVQALVDGGPELVDTFISGPALVTRATACASDRTDWLTRLEQLVERHAAVPGTFKVQQSDLFEQYARVLGTLARQGTLLLVVDDLQWADAGSISLLFHLGRELAGSRILIIGAYRPEEVALGRSGERHPLQPVVNEFKRSFGDIEVDLAQAGDRQFVDDFLDTEANRLGAEFREMLYRQTGGHALFTVELLRGMQERGDLVRDGADRWVEGSVLDWERLPARVEAVIAERIGRLPAEWQATLAVASVEGEEFTAEAVARVQAADEETLVRHLSGELSKRHRLVVAHSLQRLDSVLGSSKDGQRLSRYRFRHYLFQKYLYQSLDEVERAHLHEAMGKVLETLYGESAAEIAVQLARHFQAAGLVPKAVDYLIQAGNNAVRLSANEEGIAHFRRGLALLESLPDTPERAQQELALQMSMGAPLVATQGYGAPEAERAFGRARELCRQVGETPQLGWAVWGLKTFYHLRAQYQTALELAEQCLVIAQRTDDSALLVGAHMITGSTLTHLGKFAPARAHYEQGIARYDPEQHRALAFRHGHDPKVGCLSYGAAGALWHLGYPDQALKWSYEALAQAQGLDHPHTLAYALHFAAILHICRREVRATRERAEADIALCTEQGFPLWLGATTIFRAWAMVMQGQGGDWISQMRQGMAAFEATGAKVVRPMNLCLLADAYAKMGQPGEGLKVLNEALDAVNDTGEGWWEAEVYRLRGELLGAKRVQTEAEACFRQAIEVARRQEAKSWELRAAMSLSRLLQKQGKQEEARQLLAEVYDWFTEGFGTADLQEAKALLEELS